MSDGEVVAWAVGASVLTFVVTLVAIPLVLVRLPPYYFARPETRLRQQTRHPLVHVALLVAKNLLGIVLVAVGVVFLLTPGQGLLTILIGLSLVDFPGKYRLERAIVGRPRVLRAINRLRARLGAEPLLPPRAPGVPEIGPLAGKGA